MFHVKKSAVLSAISGTTLLFCSLLFSAQCNAALQVDKMFHTSNEHGNGTFTLSNNSSNRVYVKAEVVKLETVDGKLKKTPLTRDNFPLWDLAISPSKAVLNGGEVKDFSVKYLCENNCDRSKDRVYQIRFLPVPPPEDIKGQSIGFRFGVGPAYIIPSLESKVDYDFDYDNKEKKITLYNKGNGFLKMEVNGCPTTTTDTAPSVRKVACRGVFYILAGRKKEFVLPKSMKNDSVKITVANYDQSYEKSHNIFDL